MDLEVEIPIWYNGKMKWISNLTNRSTCSDVIQAILSSDANSNSNSIYLIYECWRGVERPLKGRCRLLKLWDSWAGESLNVTLTMREEQSFSNSNANSTHFLLRQQEKKLEKLRRKLRRRDEEMEKYSVKRCHSNSSMSKDRNETISFVNIFRSINEIQRQIESEEKFISQLIEQIEEENRLNSNCKDFHQILSDVNQTLIISRQLTEQSEELSLHIEQINEQIENKQILLDEFELDLALEQNIDLDSLDEQQFFTQLDEDFSPPPRRSPRRSPSPPSLPQKIKSVFSRPTAIVEPSLARQISSVTMKSSDLICKGNFGWNQLIERREKICGQSSFSTNEESDTGISSFNSTDDQQLVTLV